MNSLHLHGILTDVFPLETFPNFTKRVFWLRQPDTERYPEHWQLELTGDDWKRIDAFKVGDRLDCEVLVRGRKWSKNGKDGVMVSLKCIGIGAWVPTVKGTSPVTRAYNPKPGTPRKPFERDDDDGDLPF